jgi:transcriptional regulator with XRE-family HTH domain
VLRTGDGPQARVRRRSIIATDMAKQQKRSPNPIDKHVGMRVRMQRIKLGLSQEKLAANLGVTFQQVQKYEKGINRIAASRLQQIGDIFMVPESFFFEGENSLRSAPFRAVAPVPSYLDEFIASADGSALVSAFSRIKNPKLRRRIVDLVGSIVEEASAKRSK